MYGLGPRSYFRSSFNCFDFGVSVEPVRVTAECHMARPHELAPGAGLGPVWAQAAGWGTVAWPGGRVSRGEAPRPV